MRVIVTRPAGQAAAWVDGLRAQGIDAVALPLIGIAPVADAAPLQAAWGSLAERRLAVLVSPNAAECFFAARQVAQGASAARGRASDEPRVGGAAPIPDLPAAPLPWPPGTLAGSPGPGTTQTLLRLGVPAAQIVAPAADAPQFDSESLWTALQAHDWRGASVLIVRGGSGRDWLADTLLAQGARVEAVAAYRRVVPTWSIAERRVLAAALDRPEAHVWLFSSSEAIDHLDAAVTVPPAWAHSTAIASHPRIAERARRLGFGRVVPASPMQSAVVACIQSLGP